jgi:hypothetical protein
MCLFAAPSWLGLVTGFAKNSLLKSLLNVTLTVENLVIKVLFPSAVATLTAAKIAVFGMHEEEEENVSFPRRSASSIVTSLVVPTLSYWLHVHWLRFVVLIIMCANAFRTGG